MTIRLKRKPACSVVKLSELHTHCVPYTLAVSMRRLTEKSTVKINIRAADRVIPATLNDSKAAQDFASLLPLSLILDDYASTEKVSNLPRKLSTEGAAPGFAPSVGDIAYYAPWGNLAIYYRDFEYSTGLVPLGTLASGADIFASSRSMQVTIELAPR